MIIFNFLGHFVIGSGFGLAVTNSPLIFLCILFGSLLLDIDHRNSILGRLNPFVRWMKHRGHCHSFIGSAIISLPFLFFGLQIYGFIFFGTVLHILGDKFLSWFPRKQYFALKLW